MERSRAMAIASARSMSLLAGIEACPGRGRPRVAAVPAHNLVADVQGWFLSNGA